jgi:signal transduction histidine kinase
MTDVNIFVRGVAHDLNNQIMILLHALDRVLMMCPDDPDAKYAMKAAEDCAKLAGQLLPNNRERRIFQPVSLKAAVSEAAMFVRPLLPAGNRLEVDCRSDCTIDFAPFEMQQAITNLCLNAVDAMAGPGVIRLSTERSSASATISVADTGPGVPPELRERIFEPLFTTKSNKGGNGLGLALVKELVQKSGGTISVHDVVPHGAEFRISLPVFL